MVNDNLEEEKKLTFNKVPIHELINFDEVNDEPIKVSVIVPVCNVEEYLHQCVDSAINQTLKEIEIICVNDGSSDSSLEILKEYAQKDKRVKIIDKDNAGYGHVMNIGMDMASGEYIAILESDDYVLPEMYEKMYNIAIEHDLDFIKSDFYRFYGEGDKLIKNYNRVPKNFDVYNKILCPEEDQYIFKFIMNTWSGIYKNDFLRENVIRHNETPGASFQDNGFWFKTNVFAKKVMFIEEAFYMNRRDNPNSSVYNPEKIYCANTEYQLIYDYLEKVNKKEKFLDVYNLKRFHNYMFTLTRIAPEFRKEYIVNISKEFKESKEKNELKSKFYTPGEWNIIKWIMRDPVEYYYEAQLKKTKVSVILPVYNTEKYLPECLDSLLNQTLKDIEIICINDGSTDNSLEILQEYQANDQRIRILNQENQGAAIARNKGIQMAEGEYLSFLDADDFFDENMLKWSYEKAQKTNSDICIYGSYLYDNLTKKEKKCTFAVRKNELPKNHVFNRTQIQTNIFHAIMGWAWDKLYKKSFVLNNNLEFQDQRTTNDMYFVFASLLKASRITILDELVYYHRRNDPNSLSNTRELSWKCFYNALIKVRNELKQMQIYDEYEQDFINYALHSCLWNFNTLHEPTAEKLFHKLRNEWFASLDIPGHDANYFTNKNEYKQYMDLLNIPLDDKDAYTHYQINYWKDRYQWESTNMVSSLPVKIDEDETLTVGVMKSKLLWNREQNKKWVSKFRIYGDNVDRVIDLEKSEQKLKEIESSKAYKLSLKLAWLPRKIRQILKR